MGNTAILHATITLFVIFMTIAVAFVLLRKSRKASGKLPESWRNSFNIRNYQRSILSLIIYLSINFCFEAIAFYIAQYDIYNGYIMAINATIHTFFLFGFFFFFTRTLWKQVAYLVLYCVLPIYFLSVGYYYPDAVLTGNFTLVFYSVVFLAGLIHLTELLLNLETELFWFQLRVNLCILVFSLIAATVSSFTFHEASFNLSYSAKIFYIHFSNVILYYIVLTFIFILELLKLRRA
ncbi:hypothetical protein D3C87_196670 [compost metagenome]